jgi:DNA-binding LacI/PurR family transcriptional regulator
LTTVRQPHRQKGEEAARLLLALMEGRVVPAVTMLETELVVRGTTRAV